MAHFQLYKNTSGDKTFEAATDKKGFNQLISKN